MALSDSWLRGALGKSSDGIVVKSDRDGLSVRVSAKGKITFQFRYRWNGSQERVDIGTYPATSLKDARDEAIRMKGEIESNLNPRLMKKMRREDSFASLSVTNLLRQWYDGYCIKNKKKHAGVLRSFELYIFPSIGAYEHESTGLHHWLEIIEPLAQKSPAMAERVLINVKQAHRWANRRQLTKNMPLNEVGTIDVGIKRNVAERVLDSGEIKTLFEAMDSSHIHTKYQLLVKLCLLFACRRGELLLAEKKHFDLENMIWTIPPEFHKTGMTTKKPLVRPIIPEAREMLETLFEISKGSRLLITMEKEDKPIQDGSINYIPVYIRSAAERNLGIKMGKWTMHDLRRTARTNFSDLTEPHIAEIMLGHRLPGVWQVYDKSTYIDEQRRAYSLWWARVMAIVYGEGKVSLLITG